MGGRRERRLCSWPLSKAVSRGFIWNYCPKTRIKRFVPKEVAKDIYTILVSPTIIHSFVRSSQERTPFHQLAILTMANAYLVTSAVVAVLAMAVGAAYMAGALDLVIERVWMMFFEARAEGEEKKMEVRGMKEGEDFFEGMWCCSLEVLLSRYFYVAWFYCLWVGVVESLAGLRGE